MLDPALDLEDAARVADTQLILAEMDKVKRQIDAMIKLERAIYLQMQ
jgi:hypothetical protein